MARINFNIDDELLEKIDALAKAHYTSRTAYIVYTLAQVVHSQEKLYGSLGKTLSEKLNEGKEKENG